MPALARGNAGSTVISEYGPYSRVFTKNKPYNSTSKNIRKVFASKINLFRKIKSLKINHVKINSILFISLILSIFDYAFIILSCPTQNISADLQIIQTRILRQIVYFPPGTKIIDIHKAFGI